VRGVAIVKSRSNYSSFWLRLRFIICPLTYSVQKSPQQYGYDSIQLAAAFEVARISQTSIFFACYDLRLNKAAKLLGILCL